MALELPLTRDFGFSGELLSFCLPFQNGNFDGEDSDDFDFLLLLGVDVGEEALVRRLGLVDLLLLLPSLLAAEPCV